MEDNDVEETENVTSTDPVEKKKDRTISFSQYAMWLKCPMQWKLAYVDNLRTYEDSIHTAFGSAIHHALQTYLSELYNSGLLAAEKLDYMQLFHSVYDVKVKNIPNITPEVIEEFRLDGKTILDHFFSLTIRQKHFPSKKYEVLGVELPLTITLRSGKVKYKGFLDIVMRDRITGKIHIFDFKTSTFGWNKWQKMDRTKLDQLVLYKRFYSKLHNVPMDNIEVEFIIFKRRLQEDVEYPQQRIQRVTPITGKMMVKQVETSFIEFVQNGFTDEGEYNKDGVFFKMPGKAKKNCKYCPFKDKVNPATNEKYCNGKE